MSLARLIIIFLFILSGCELQDNSSNDHVETDYLGTSNFILNNSSNSNLIILFHSNPDNYLDDPNTTLVNANEIKIFDTKTRFGSCPPPVAAFDKIQLYENNISHLIYEQYPIDNALWVDEEISVFYRNYTLTISDVDLNL